MPKPWYSIKAEVAEDVAEVSILDAINDWYGVSAKQFLTEFRALKAGKVKLYINSPGGSVFDAVAIYNGMLATGKQIEVHVLGIAASAASYIAMAGHKIVMPANTMMFLHNPINAVYGNAAEMRDMAEILDKIGASLTATYAGRWKGGEQALTDVLAAETYLTAAECFEYGLCDEVVPEITAQARFDVDSLPAPVQALFKRAAPVALTHASPTAEEVERLCAKATVSDHAASIALDPKLTTIGQVEARIAEVREISALCRMTGRPDDIKAHVAGHKSLPEVRALLNAAMVEDDANTAVDTAAKAKTLEGPKSKTLDPHALWRDIKKLRGSK